MRVLIVGKTKMGPNVVCVGGWDLDNNISLRLLTPQENNHWIDTPYQIGDVWDLTYHGRRQLEPPHNEDVLVTAGRRIGPLPDLTATLRRITNPLHGSIEELYERFLQFPGAGTGYVTRQTGLPSFSTQFWITDGRLSRDDFRAKIRYRYDGATIRTVTYKGMEDDPVFAVPQGTLVRVSLARWFDFGEAPNPKCYLQLSGWYL